MANSGTLTNIPSANPNAPAAIFPVGSPEAMFKDGYRLEMSGRLREAEQVYEQIILSSSNTQTAMLANDRLNNLRRNTREQSVRVAEQQAPRPERQSGVVAVNEPRNLPRYAQPTGQVVMSETGAGDASGGMTANLTGLNVCSQRGMYDKESRWCGLVLADDGARLSIEIKDVVLPGFGNMGIQSSKCSGGTFINWFSRGSMVRVPRSCMELKGYGAALAVLDESPAKAGCPELPALAGCPELPALAGRRESDYRSRRWAVLRPGAPGVAPAA